MEMNNHRINNEAIEFPPSLNEAATIESNEPFLGNGKRTPSRFSQNPLIRQPSALKVRKLIGKGGAQKVKSQIWFVGDIVLYFW